MSGTRRTLLQTLLLGVVGLAGCSSGLGRTADEIRFWLAEASASGSKRDTISPITCAGVTQEEREIIRTAIERGEYRADADSASAALERLRRRIRDQNPGGLDVYLTCDGTLYRVGFVDGDHIIADPEH